MPDSFFDNLKNFVIFLTLKVWRPVANSALTASCHKVNNVSFEQEIISPWENNNYSQGLRDQQNKAVEDKNIILGMIIIYFFLDK